MIRLIPSIPRENLIPMKLIQFSEYEDEEGAKTNAKVISKLTTEEPRAMERTIAAFLNINRKRPVSMGIKSKINNCMGSNYQSENNKQQNTGHHGKEIKTHISAL